ncbi:MAG: universal stress protein [Pseudorhodoplanes sp.]|nr:hypothetical protein [Pseudorhodoplanes sp.]MBW7948137.1 universal stress protein [Pseudorhodoplanes sp.]MCL4710379.1 universal stress protein [Pseudorhodoplanes sp.]MCQ3942739.1 universal stress protein [Alphaproteobacteria bacterium]MCZ7641596.1 universal stress protein [Pseudorhodoplanes sp.]
MYKDILLNLSVDSDKDPAADYALSVADAFEAHVSAVAYAYEQIIPGPVIGTIATDVIAADRAACMKAAQNAIAKFENAAKLAGRSFDTRICQATPSEAMRDFAFAARRADLTILGQPEPDEKVGPDLILEAALFQSGRPMLTVPYIQRGGLKLNRAICCWDGSATAARAIGDAVPLLKKAKSIDLIVVATSKIAPDDVAGADMGHHLARHGLNVTVKQLSSSNIEVADVILSYAADFEADLIVMGGYGHSRLREFILGGTTRDIIRTMTIPVLMSH